MREVCPSPCGIRPRLPRQWPWGVSVLFSVLLGCGCGEPQKKTVEMLFDEALAQSRVLRQDPARDAVARSKAKNGVTVASAMVPPLPPPPPLGGPKVSDTFLQTDVQQALQSLATQADVSIIVDEKVRGVVSASINDEPFEAALEKVLLPLGSVWRKDDGRYYIGVPEPSSALFAKISELHQYPTRNLAPKELTELLPERYKPFIKSSEKRNLILVEAPRSVAYQVLMQLQQLDAPTQQVILEAIICVYSPESGFQFGFDIDQGIALGGSHALNLGLKNLTMSGVYGPKELESLRNFTFTSAFLRAMAREGYLTIRAAPRVMAKDGEKAHINIGRESYFSIQPETSNILFRQDIEKVEAGISLNITPIVRGNTVTVTIEKAEVSEEIRSDIGRLNTSDDRFPTINRRTVSTTIHVKDGETIVIGGLAQRQQVERVEKVPVLGDIPGLGLLFQQIDNQSQDVEVAIFISPRIVRSSP